MSKSDNTSIPFANVRNSWSFTASYDSEPRKTKTKDSTPYSIQTYLTLPTQIKCPNDPCGKDLYYYPPTKINDVKAPITLSCASCKHVFPAPIEPPTETMSTLSIASTYYDILGVERSATPDEISRAYRKKSLQCHPDRVQGKQQEWDELSKAYEILGDKRKRHWYDIELEKGNVDPSEDPASIVKTDPEKFFQDIFGGERFYDVIGMSQVGKAIGEAMHHPFDEDAPSKTKEERDADEEKATEEREERIRHLTDHLAYKLDLYALDDDLAGRMDRWRARCKLETDELKNERFGVEILKAVGYVYRIKATTHPLRKSSSWSSAINARLTSWGSTYNTFSSVFSTVRKAYTVKSAFVALQDAEANPNTTPEHKQQLEEKAAKVAIEALWSGVRLEIYDVLKEVCDNVLDVNTITTTLCLDRIDALERLGVEFESAKADISTEEFVNVEHKDEV